MIYKLAEQQGEGWVGFTRVNFVTRRQLNDVLRAAFDARQRNHYFHCRTRDHVYEGGKINSWSSGESLPTTIGFTIDRHLCSLPIEEIVEVSLDYFD